MEDKKGQNERDSRCLSRSHSVPSLRQTASPENETITRAQSLPDLLLKSSFEEFTPDITVHTDPTDSDHDTSEVSISVSPPSSWSFSTYAHRKRKSKSHSLKSEKKHKKDSFSTASSTDYPVDMSGHLQDDAREMEPHSAAGPSNLQLSSSDDEDSDSAGIYGKRARIDWMSGYDEDTTSVLRPASCGVGGYFPTTPSQAQDQTLHPPDRKDTDDGGPSFDSSSSTFSMLDCSQSTAPTAPQHPQRRKTVLVLKESTVRPEGSKAQDAFELLPVQSESDSGGDSYTPKMSTQPTHSHVQIPSSDPGSSQRDSRCLSHSHSVPSLRQTASPENETFTRAQSLPDLLLKSSFEEFTPDITVHTDPTDSDHDTSEVSVSVPPSSSQSFSTSTCRKRKSDLVFGTASRTDYISDDDDSNSADFYGKKARMAIPCRGAGYLRASTPSAGPSMRRFSSTQAQERTVQVPNRKDTDDGGPSFDSSSSAFNIPTRSQSTAPTVLYSSRRRKAFKKSAVCTEGSKAQDAFELLPLDLSGHKQDDAREMEPVSAAVQPDGSDDSDTDSADVCGGVGEMGWLSEHVEDIMLLRGIACERFFPTTSSQAQTLHPPERKDTDDGHSSLHSSSSALNIPTCSQSTAPTVPQHRQGRRRFLVRKNSAVCTEGSKAQDAFELLPLDLSGHKQDNAREMEPVSAAVQPDGSDDSDTDSAEFCGGVGEMGWLSEHVEDIMLFRGIACGGFFPTTSSQAQTLHPPERKDTDDGGPSYCSQSIAPTFFGPPCPQDRPVVPQDSAVCTEGSGAQEDDVVMEMETSDTALNYSVTNNQSTHSHLQLSSSNPGWTARDSSCSFHSHSVPSLSQEFEEFTPEISVDEDDETYRFQCSCPGLYQCSVTGLLFHMEAEGDVVYRTVPWDRRLLAQHHKQPAGPLFDIKCVQQSVCQLHLPHCEIRSTGGCEFLSVAHVNDEGIEFIVPQKITETHVIINITGFSGFGNVKDEDSPPDPVRALVLLFYRPPADPDPESLLNVLLLPVNIVLRDVVRTRKKLVGDEIYIETSPHCKLCPKQEYTLSTCPEDDSVLVQPTEAEFDCDNYDNYFPSFQVILEKIMKHIKLCLRDTNKHSVWERRVGLSSSGVKKPCTQDSSSERLLDIRRSFVSRISEPGLNSLLDKLLEKTTMTDSEMEAAYKIQNHRDKARFVIDTVRKKGEAASSEMMKFLCEVDPVLCEHLDICG